MSTATIGTGKAARDFGTKRRFLLLLAGLSVAVVCSLATGESARASSPVYEYFIRPSALSTAQAGGHPDITFQWKIGNRATQLNTPSCVCNDPKILIQDFPTGMIGNPHATPQCDLVSFNLGSCPIDSQVGIVALLLGNDLGPGTGYFFFPLYNMIPHPDEAGLVAFQASTAPIFTQLSARTGSDYGLRGYTSGFQRIFPLFSITSYLWGVPADPAHDELRWPASGQGGLHECIIGIGDPRPYLEFGEFPPPSECLSEFNLPHSSTSPLTPFLSNPTVCGGALASSVETVAYDNEHSRGETLYPPITGCDLLSFNPSLSAKPTTTEVDAASGLDVNLSVPQTYSATTPSPSQIKATTVTLPEGFSINANAADGKTTCSDAQARFGTELGAECPEFSKIGSLSIDSSALPAPILGYLYLGDPRPGDRYRIILAADGFATHVKLAGSAVPDPSSGRLTLRFVNLPQSPLTRFRLHVFGSERGVLATPTQCGSYEVRSTFTPWDGALAEQKASQFFTLDQGPGGTPCPSAPRRFAPSFEAAAVGNTAGAHNAFAIDITRPDGTQELTGLTVTPPPGFTATLRGVRYCPEPAIARLSNADYSGLTEQASPSCPADSRVGTVVAGAGAGSRPLYVEGDAYLAGPYKGAPVSLLAVIPAVSGPYDLGNVSVRAALYVDPLTAQVTAVSDPLPSIVGGIPLRTRSIQVKLDRPNFSLNPTNCDPRSVEATISGREGGSQKVSSLYQVANCSILEYGPKLRLGLSGGLNRLGHPSIHATLIAEAGEANSRRISVTLPPGELLDNSHIDSICTRVAFAKDECPQGSLVGNVTVETPLLDRPLAGNIYLRSSSNELPDLALDLEGQFDIEAAGKIDSVDGRLRTTFETIPDVPFSRIAFNLVGGKKGLLQNSKSLCGVAKRATVRMVGQNEARSDRKVRLRTSCGFGDTGRRGKNRHRGGHR